MSPDWSEQPQAVPYADLMNPQSLNLYGYVGNNPLSRADKEGHQQEEIPSREETEKEDAEFYKSIAEFSRRQASEEGARGRINLTPEVQEYMDRFLERSGGRFGGTPTRSQNVSISDALELSGYRITGGGGRGPEERIPGPDGTPKGGTYVDITARNEQETIRVQTVTTLADGKTPTPNEQAAATRIKQAFPKDKLFIIPKQNFNLIR